MDAIQFLKREHQTAGREMEKVVHASPDERGGLWKKLAPELGIHEQIEDACVYEPIAQEARSRDSVLAAWREKHQGEVEDVKGLMEEIEELDAKEEAWLAKVKEVHARLKAHIAEEEGTIFPRISHAWDKARLEKAGAMLEEMQANPKRKNPGTRR